ncbi:hypothetical protein L211DRAFT_815718 [Terfezia boudieri ATCC MYA-4762]|uniref:Uncharacterized protein n=1 Tax=Terfezia boudieri ATCC MYA-4762 TaxID=1051890 RepID=A0A3N4L5J6_9PEZI|nr:hypothetical protein L211DRAFT_815718 [Terfezia boudieri ATCC MYA-4762]
MDVGSCLLAGCPCQHGQCSLQTHRASDNTLYYTFFPCASCMHSFEQHSAPIGPESIPTPAPDTAMSIISREKRRRLSDHPRTPRRPVYSRAHVPNVPGSPSRPQDDICPRTDTVRNLYQRLLQQRVLLVRGTPAIGKTTLLKLLYYYIDTLDDGPSVFRINGWAQGRVAESKGWANHISRETEGLDVRDASVAYVILLDEAQSTYWDDQLWSEFVKELSQGSWNAKHHYLVMFSSYGSVSLPDAITPPHITAHQLVSLRPNNDHPYPLGLLLSEEEFTDALARKCRHHKPKPIQFTEDVSSVLYAVTQGHAGALHSLIDSFTSYIVTPKSGHYAINQAILKGKTIELDLIHSYFADFNISFDSLAATPWRRGLPTRDNLQSDYNAARLLGQLVRDRVLFWHQHSEQDQKTLERAHRKGWIHSVSLGNERSGSLAYVLPSQLHEWYISLMLFAPSEQLSQPALGITTPLELALLAIRHFRPSALRAPARIGPSTIHRPHEAIFQDEFYRGCHVASKGKILATPECGTKQGRIDFFVPTLKWGFELLRNGHRLQAHADRFLQEEGFSSGGAYGSWVTEGVMDNYLLLDFRDNMPRKPLLPDVEQLYHVVFAERFMRVCVVDSKLQQVTGWIRLLEAEGLR